jgi:hypothetical protein
MTKDETVYTKVTFGSSNQEANLQGRIWLTGTAKQITAELSAKGFEVLTKRPTRAVEKPAKVVKAKKAKKTLVAA